MTVLGLSVVLPEQYGLRDNLRERLVAQPCARFNGRQRTLNLIWLDSGAATKFRSVSVSDGWQTHLNGGKQSRGLCA